MEQIKKVWNKYYDYLIIVIIYGLLHIFIHTDYWDDVTMSSILESYQYNLFHYLSTTWNTWSSALFLHAVEVVVEFFPNFVWKILDVVMILIMYHYLAQIVKLLSVRFVTFTPASQSYSVRPWTLLLFMSFPYSLFATAGWMTTTIAYAWTFSTLFYALYHFLSSSTGAPVKWWTFILYEAAILYCANCNLVSFSLVPALVFVYFQCKTKTRSFRLLFVEGLIGSVLNIILFAVCPGNKIRNIEDARYHNTSDILNLSIGGHLRMGINSAFYHFVSVPNIILFTLCLLLVVCVFIKTRKVFTRFISCIPLAIDIFWTGYLFLSYTLPNRTLTYIYPDAAFLVCPRMEQYFVLASALVMVALMCYSIAYLTDFSYLSWILIGNILVFGLFPNVALGFTATITASIMRIASFFYFSMILCACVLADIYVVLKANFWKYILYLLGGLGTLLNILQIVRHIIVYG